MIRAQPGPGLGPGQSLCCVVEQDALLSQCLSVNKWVNCTKWVPASLMQGFNSRTDHPIHGGGFQ